MGVRSLWDRLTHTVSSAADQGPDHFPYPPEHPYAAAHARVSAYLRQMLKTTGNQWELEPQDCEEGKALLAESREFQAQLIAATAQRLAEFRRRKPDTFDRILYPLSALARALAPKGLTHTEDTLATLLETIAGSPTTKLRAGLLGYFPCGHVVRQVQRYVETSGLTPRLREALKRYGELLENRAANKDDRKAHAKLLQLLGEAPEEVALLPEPWTRALIAEVNALPGAEAEAWRALLNHCRNSGGTKPSKKWLDAARSLVAGVGEERFRTRVAGWLRQLDTPYGDPMPEVNAETLRGLLWTCGLFDEPETTRAVGAAAEACFRKIPGIGARSVLAGNGALAALSLLATPEAVAQLARLRMRVKTAQTQTAIGKALEEAAARAGTTRADLEELCLPSYGLDADGVLREQLGVFTAEVSFTLAGQAEWRWLNAEGKAQKSVPEAVKRDCAEELAALKKTVAEIQKMLPAQRARVEGLLRTERVWPCEHWRARYVEHPLLGRIGRALVWHFREGERAALGLFQDGEVRDLNGGPLGWLTGSTEVRLWHPIGFDPGIVLAWRRRLEELQVIQPFKQAHREVYVLTDAEIGTHTYSNRFAGHILRHHQLTQLGVQKGWRHRLYDDDRIEIDLPDWGLKAEFWLDFPPGPVSEMGIAVYVSTDQARFIDAASREPRALSEVPALVFTEIMRDVDLFVSVASIGTDPEWRDRGEERWGDYWHAFSFGDLNASAQTRREVLERLVPRLKIAERCRLDGKFLRVRGDLRAYKIHLGSGNILMEPNDQYLCIVADRGPKAAGEVFLPFEGDATLSIILSKAFMLADDRNIKDPSILSQIRPR